MTALVFAKALQKGLNAWQANDQFVDNSCLAKAFRDNWDKRIGKEKFGGVWSIQKAKSNLQHPASIKSIEIKRKYWTGKTVTVDHAIPVKVMFSYFMNASSDSDLQRLIDAYSVAVITREEDSILNALKLKDSMPENWDWDKDPTIRWKMANIKVEC